MSARCENVFFRDSSDDLFAKPRSLFVVGEKKQVKQCESIAWFKRIDFHTCGPQVEIYIHENPTKDRRNVHNFYPINN